MKNLTIKPNYETLAKIFFGVSIVLLCVIAILLTALNLML